MKSHKMPSYFLSLAFTVAMLHAEKLPNIQSASLAGTELDLPSALSGHVAVLCIGFSHSSQSEVKGWTTALRSQLGNEPVVTVYPVAVLEDAPRLVRGMIVHSMKGSVPPGDQGKFLVVYKNEKELKQVVGFGTPDDAYVIVLDQAGIIQYKLHGAPNAEAAREVSDHLAVILKSSSPPK